MTSFSTKKKKNLSYIAIITLTSNKANGHYHILYNKALYPETCELCVKNKFFKI